MIIEVFSSGPADTNVYLCACQRTKKAVIIDAPFECLEWVQKTAQKHGLQIEKILLTHSHWDHTAEVASLKEIFQVPVYVHSEDANNLIDPGSDGLPLFFSIQGVKPDGFLQDGDLIQLGDLTIEVIATPGHTPGGVCFFIQEEKVLFSGDTLFKGTIGNLSFQTARPSLMWESLKRLAKLPQETRVFPGHGAETTIKKEQWIAHAKERFS